MRHMLKGKIHRATVTGADLAYEGSIGIDPVLLEAAGMAVYEQVHVLDIDNGNRLVTYIIEGKRGSGDIVLNGAAARLVAVGDLVIIVTYDLLDNEAAKTHKPSIVVLGEGNKIARRIS